MIYSIPSNLTHCYFAVGQEASGISVIAVSMTTVWFHCQIRASLIDKCTFAWIHFEYLYQYIGM